MSIFISIASYCDPLLGFTIERARATARWPDGLRFGVVDQSDTPLATPPSGYVRIAPAAARGPCWARALAMSFYHGEDWFLQIDSHTDFDKGWDEILIDQGKPNTALTGYPAVLSRENGDFIHGDNSGVFVGSPRRDATFPVVMFQAGLVHAPAAVPAAHLGACALFAPGGFATAFPYDPQLYFHGEEQTLFLRLYTHGWDILHPLNMPIYHMYATDKSRVMHWDRDPRWGELERHSRMRVEALLAGEDLGVYGLGKARTLADYAAFSGIDYAKRVIEERAFLSPAPPAPPVRTRWY
jgi:hypothetical protein